MVRCWCALAIALAAAGSGGCGDKREAPTPAPAKPLAKPAPAAAATSVTIAGTVVGQSTGTPVPNVEVVLRGDSGDTKTRASASGAFSVVVAPGTYRAFVRDDHVLSTGLADRVRLDNNVIRKELVGLPDEGLMFALDARTDLKGIELTVAVAAELSGTVRDPDDHEVHGAIVRVRPLDRFGGARPVLGTDTALTDEHGQFTLHVPAGSYVLDASHPDFAGVRGASEIALDAGDKSTMDVSLVRGCIVSGRVVTADGSPANDGAIEKLGAPGGPDFGPAGRIEGGTFRWVTTDDENVTLRAWPWHSPPSTPRFFTCHDGKRFTDVVYRLPDQRPDISGTIVDDKERPVPLAYLDILPLDPGHPSQQERADAAGSWHVYDMPPGRYKVTASAPGAGIIDQVVVAPRQDQQLRLGGTGRVVGTTTELVDGSVEVSFVRCGSKDSPLQIQHEPRIVPVVAGRFVVERAPACALSLAVRWRDRLSEVTTVVEPDHTAYIDVDVGAPREKTVSGVIKDLAGNPVEGARVTAVIHDKEAATTRSDGQGRYTLKTHSGAQLVAGKGEHVGRATVGRANVASELLDLVLDDADF
jgi:hypothetical protein